MIIEPQNSTLIERMGVKIEKRPTLPSTDIKVGELSDYTLLPNSGS